MISTIVNFSQAFKYRDTKQTQLNDMLKIIVIVIRLSKNHQSNGRQLI